MASTLVSAAVLVMGLLICTARAQLPQLPQGCSTQVAVLLPCLGFVQGQSSSPSQACCNALGGVVKNSPLCLCALVAAGAGNNPGVNTTLALTLPSRCNMKGLDPSRSCKANGGSAPAQQSAPAPSAARQSAPAPSAVQQAAQTPSQVPSSSPQASSSGVAAPALPPRGSSNGEQHLTSAHSPAVEATTSAALLGFALNWKMLSFSAALALVFSH